MASVENAAVISYNGKDIKSLEAGKTGTVRCKGKKMKTDLVVKAFGTAAPKLQEKTLTANGVYPPDSGYDGFSKVTVDVKGSGGGEGIGANISIKSGICPVIPTQILIERPTINIEGTGEVTE